MRAPLAYRLKPSNRRDEAELQERVVATLDAYLPDQVRFFGSPNGLKLHPKYLGRLRKIGVRRGCPDLTFCCLLNGEWWAIELKAGANGLTPEQREIAEAMGDRFAVCRSWEAARSTLEAWMAPHGLRFLTDTESVRREAQRRTAA